MQNETELSTEGKRKAEYIITANYSENIRSSCSAWIARMLGAFAAHSLQ